MVHAACGVCERVPAAWARDGARVCSARCALACAPLLGGPKTMPRTEGQIARGAVTASEYVLGGSGVPHVARVVKQHGSTLRQFEKDRLRGSLPHVNVRFPNDDGTTYVFFDVPPDAQLPASGPGEADVAAITLGALQGREHTRVSGVSVQWARATPRRRPRGDGWIPVGTPPGAPTEFYYARVAPSGRDASLPAPPPFAPLEAFQAAPPFAPLEAFQAEAAGGPAGGLAERLRAALHDLAAATEEAEASLASARASRAQVDEAYAAHVLAMQQATAAVVAADRDYGGAVIRARVEAARADAEHGAARRRADHARAMLETIAAELATSQKRQRDDEGESDANRPGAKRSRMDPLWSPVDADPSDFDLSSLDADLARLLAGAVDQ